MASERLRVVRARVLYRALVIVSAIGRRLPLRLGRVFGRGLGGLAWHVARRERRKALANVARAFPDWPAADHRRTIRAMFRHFGVALFEIAWLPNITMANVAETTRVEGLDRIVELVRAGRSIVVFTGHCGNWEWLAFTCGLHVPVSVIQRERDEAGMNDYITALRARAGIRTVDRGSAASAREIIQALRRPGVLAFLIDQSIRAESAKIEFFGIPALTPIGPAKLAIRTEAAVVTAFIHRQDDGIQHVRFFEPIDTHRGDDPIALTTKITRQIEEQIRAHPDQWVWMHDRWRDRPEWDVGRS